MAIGEYMSHQDVKGCYSGHQGLGRIGPCQWKHISSPHFTRCKLSATADYLYFWPIQVFDYLKSPKGSLGKTAGCFSLLDIKDMKEDASRRQWEILKEAEEKENKVGRKEEHRCCTKEVS